LIGKYSPTVHTAYSVNQEWHEEYSGGLSYDPEGYDMYGYNSDGYDRVGYMEHDYYYTDEEYDDDFGKYDVICDDWGYDGLMPYKLRGSETY
jgi:hypothetical protein